MHNNKKTKNIFLLFNATNTDEVRQMLERFADANTIAITPTSKKGENMANAQISLQTKFAEFQKAVAEYDSSHLTGLQMTVI